MIMLQPTIIVMPFDGRSVLVLNLLPLREAVDDSVAALVGEFPVTSSRGEDNRGLSAFAVDGDSLPCISCMIDRMF